MRVRTRLFFGFAVLLVLLLGVSIFSMFQMVDLAYMTTELYDHPLTVSNAIRDVDTYIIKMHRSMKDVAMAENGDQIDLAVEEVNKLEAQVLKKLDTVQDAFLGNKEDVEDMRTAFKNWKPIRDEVILLTRNGEKAKAAAITKGKGARYIEGLEKKIDDFIKFAGNKADTFLENAQASKVNSLWIVIGLVALAILASMTIAYFITLSITRPVDIAVGIAKKLSKGEIDVEVGQYSNDEMGSMLTSMNDMAANLRQQMSQLTEGINVLATSASEISTTTAQFATTTQEVATSVNQVVVSMKEVKQTSEMASDKAKDMAERSKAVVQTSRNGEAAVQETIDAINTIQEQMMSIADSVVGLSDQSQSIGEIIAAVDDVSDQSRLLAVNASIEAVKAGEQGKGFSVVADEIKSLAEQSKQSTSQVRTILTDIQKATSAAVMSTEKGSKAVDNGVTQANHTGGSIRTLGESINQTSQSAVQIDASSRQQVAGIDQVFGAMENISNAIEQNVSGAKQLEDSARDLEELGNKLKAIVEKYRL